MRSYRQLPISLLLSRASLTASSSSGSSSLLIGGTALHTLVCGVHTARVPRGVALARWNAIEACGAAAAGSSSSLPFREAAEQEKKQGMLGKGMSFATGLLQNVAPSSRSSCRDTSVAAEVGDVRWDLCERMDYYVQYSVPSNWRMQEFLRENSISIQCCPPPPARPSDAASAATATGVDAEGEGSAFSIKQDAPSVHGISLNCFAYKRRMKEPNSEKLLHTFLKRFDASVSNSLQILSECGGTDARDTPIIPQVLTQQEKMRNEGGETEEADRNISEVLATQLRSAVAEITFTPGPGQPLAHGLCRAFYNSNGRFHYVAVVAVPDDEFDVSRDLVIHALMAVVESRVEAATKNT